MAFIDLSTPPTDRMSTPGGGGFVDLSIPPDQRPKTGGEGDVVTDFAHNLKIGMDVAAQDTRELIGRIPGVGQAVVSSLDAVDKWWHNKPSEELLKEDIAQQAQAQTPESQAAMQKKWDTLGPESAWRDPRSYLSGFAQSLPEEGIMMFPAMALAKGVYATSLAKIMGEAAFKEYAASAGTEAAGKLAQTAASNAAAKVASVAGGAIEGVYGGAQSSRQVRDEINGLSEAQLKTSQAFTELTMAGLTTEQAKDKLANDAATKAFFLSGAVTGAFAGLGDRMLAKIITTPGGLVRRFATGALTEGVLEELPQSAGQQLAQNYAAREAIPTKPLMEDVANQALGGLAIGAMQGGGMAAVMGSGNVDRAIVSARKVVSGTPIDTRKLLDEATAFRANVDANLAATAEERAKADRSLQQAQLLRGSRSVGEIIQTETGDYYAKNSKGDSVPLKVWDEETPAGVSPKGAAALREHYSALGRRIVFYQDDQALSDGAYDREQPGVLFLSNNPSRAVVEIAGHEFKHSLEGTVDTIDGAKSAGEILSAAIQRGMTSEGTKYAFERFTITAPERPAADATPEQTAAHEEAVFRHIYSELGADIMGEAPKFESFLPRVMAQIEAQYGGTVAGQILQRLIEGVQTTAAAVRSLFANNETQSQKWITNLDEVHDLLARYQVQQYGTQVEREQAKLESQRRGTETERLAAEARNTAGVNQRIAEGKNTEAVNRQIAANRAAAMAAEHVVVLESERANAEKIRLEREKIEAGRRKSNQDLLTKIETRQRELDRIVEIPEFQRTAEERLLLKEGPVKIPEGVTGAARTAAAAMAKAPALRSAEERMAIKAVQQSPKIEPTDVSSDDEGELHYPGQQTAFFGNGGAYLIFTKSTKNEVRLHDMMADDDVRGRQMLDWLMRTHGKPIVEDVVPRAVDYWKKMQREGRIKSWKPLRAIKFSPKSATVNIGLDVGDKKDAVSPAEARLALKAQGVRIVKDAVHRSDTENTLVATLDHPLTPARADNVARATKQEAIAQYAEGKGELYGPKAEDWRPFNPEFFLTHEGRRLSETLRTNAATIEQNAIVQQSPKEDTSGVRLTKGQRLASSSGWLYGSMLPFQVSNQTEFAQVMQEQATLYESARTEDTPENRKWVGTVIEHEARLALKSGEHDALGWYDHMVDRMRSFAALIHPELATSDDGWTAFTYALAVTSNGHTIGQNVRYAFDIYDDYRKTGEMPVRGFGLPTQAMKIAFQRWNDQARERGGIAAYKRFLLSKFPAGELMEANPSIRELRNEVVYGGTVIGSKIGGGFFVNIQKQFDALTMDRWMVRSWGRIVGDMLDTNGEIRNNPGGGSNRRYIRESMKYALERLQKDYPSLTMADLQALLWYEEKALYSMHKVNPEEPTDYAKETEKYIRSKGIRQPAIDEAGRSAREYSDRSQARAADTGGEEVVSSPKSRGQAAGEDRRTDVTQTPEFKRWFGDSVVTDTGKPMGEGGKPLVVYHGTTGEFNTFRPAADVLEETLKAEHITDQVPWEWVKDLRDTGEMYFFATDESLAQDWATASGERGKIIEAYLRVRNPAPTSDRDEAITMMQKNPAYDGALVEDTRPGGSPGGTVWIVRKPTQIKSATSNTGAFSLTNPDIRYSPKSRGQAAGENRRADVTQTPEFRRWFGNSKVIDADGRPLVVYHGTTHDIAVFKPGKTNPENDFGRGIYLTDNTEDASVNYAGEGPDLIARIQILAEQIASANDWKYDDPRALKQARKKLSGGQPNILPLFAKITNPIELEPETSTFMEHREALKFVRSVQRQMGEDAFRREASLQLGEMFETAADGALAGVMIAKAREAAMYAEDNKGNLISGEIIRRALASAGYDGIIDHTVSNKWGEDSGRSAPMTGVSAETTHYIAFRPEQIKSATGNTGAFSPTNPDIRYSPKNPVSAVGIHFSQQRRPSLNGTLFGTGMRGAEIERLRGIADKRLMQRTYFYVNAGRGIHPEKYVGSHAHQVELTNLYDLAVDPEHLNNSNENETESAILDAGYSGYLARGAGAAVLLGNNARINNPTYLGTNRAAYANVPQVEPAAYSKKQLRAHEIAADRSLPAGEMTGAEWAKLIPEATQLPPEGKYHKSDIAKAVSYSPKIDEDQKARARALGFNTRQIWYRYDTQEYNEIRGNPKGLHLGAMHFAADPQGAENRFSDIRKSLPIEIGGGEHPAFVGLTGYTGAYWLKANRSLQLRDLGIWNPDSVIRQIRSQYANTDWVHSSTMRHAKELADDWADNSNAENETTKRIAANEAIIAALKAEGYDSIKYRNTFEGGTGIMVFDPSQVRSVTAAFENPEGGNVMASPKWYSELERQVTAAKMGAAPAKMWADWLRGLTNKGVKPAEIEWSGIKDWLELQSGKVTKAQVEEYLAQNGVKVEEVELGAGVADTADVMAFHNLSAEEWGDAAESQREEWIREAGAETKFHGYQLPGGENYRELLLTLPAKKISDEQSDELAGLTLAAREGLSQKQEARRQELLRLAAPESKAFQSPHFDQPNILAHIRFNERTDAEGKSVLFLEELQSDWAQRGKKIGFVSTPITDLPAGYTLRREYSDVTRTELWYVIENGGHFGAGFNTKSEAVSDALDALNEDAGLRSAERVSSAPFVTKTEAWVALALKRMIQYAVDNGFDRVAWTTGEQQAMRYDLSKQISKIRWIPRKDTPRGLLTAFDPGGAEVIREDVETAKLQDYTGKDAAEKIMSSPAKNKDGLRELSGLDLKVGGEGMKAFYDKIVPNVANDVLKKLGGGRVELVDTNTHKENSVTRRQIGGYVARVGEEAANFNSKQDALRWVAERMGGKQPGFTITPALKAAADKGMPLFSPKAVTQTPEFKRWFGDSKVVDAKGEPLVVYHGTMARADFDTFDTSLAGSHFGSATQANARAGVSPAMIREMQKIGPQNYQAGRRIMPVYLAIKNPLRMTDVGDWSNPHTFAAGIDRATKRQYSFERQSLKNIAAGRVGDKYRSEVLREMVVRLEQLGYDGIVYNNTVEAKGRGGKSWIAFHPKQIKSATGNTGDFNPKNPSILESPKIVGDTLANYTAAQQRMLASIGIKFDEKSIADQIADIRKNFWARTRQGLFDQFDPIKTLSPFAYLQARLSKGTAGAFETLLKHGKLKLTDGVYDADTSGGFVNRVLVPLHGETTRFLVWVAGNRAEQLAREDRENLFLPADITAAKSLAQGTTAYDYTLASGRVTRNRAEIFADTVKKYDAFNRNVLDMAAQSGLIDQESRPLWEKMMYVPFFRVLEGEAVNGGQLNSGLVRQQGIRMLKGGGEKLNSDLLANVLQNWYHLIDASAKNRAAASSVQAAANLGLAIEADPTTAAQMAKSIGSNVVWYLDQGKKRAYALENTEEANLLYTAITSLDYAGLRGPLMAGLSYFKHALTVGVTASPFFKVRNLIRDSVQSAATAGISYNLAGNIKQGFEATRHESQDYVSMTASGALIRFGTMLEGREADRVRQLTKGGIAANTLLTDQGKLDAVWTKMKQALEAYNELGNRGEEINRAALYTQLIAKGMNHAEASLAARDLLDFSMQGSWTTVRFLTQIVPFMNARLQGLYKLGRATNEDKGRMAIVLGAVTLGTLALLAAYHDDDDWKKRTDADRNNWWWFKLFGTAYRIPKPFEIGAVATLAERGAELVFDREMTGQRFGTNVWDILGNQLSMNPIPQAVKPLIDIYANVDSFTNAPIETAGMEKLQPDYRYRANTSILARAASTTGQAAAQVVGARSLSPVQLDHLVEAYFGWLGTFVVGASDMAVRPLTNEPDRPSMDMWKLATGGMVRTLPENQSRYVDQIYKQAQLMEQAYGTYHDLLKRGRIQEAQEFATTERQKLIQYAQVERMKRAESTLNERIRLIEASRTLPPDEKRLRIQEIAAIKDRVGRILVLQ